MRRLLVAFSATSLLLLSACGSGSSAGGSSGATSAGTTAAQSSVPNPGGKMPLPWTRPADQLATTKAAGLSLTPQETLAVHYHSHLDVYVDGTHVPVPAELGINIGPNNTAPPHGPVGIAPLHTHDTSGILHIEAPKAMTFKLGQLFTEWGVPLSAQSAGGYSPVKAYVDGKPFKGDPSDIVLKNHEEIAIVAGSGSVKVPSSYNWPQGY